MDASDLYNLIHTHT